MRSGLGFWVIAVVGDRRRKEQKNENGAAHTECWNRLKKKEGEIRRRAGLNRPWTRWGENERGVNACYDAREASTVSHTAQRTFRHAHQHSHPHPTKSRHKQSHHNVTTTRRDPLLRPSTCASHQPLLRRWPSAKNTQRPPNPSYLTLTAFAARGLKDSMEPPC